MPRFARNDGCEVTGLPRFARNDERRNVDCHASLAMTGGGMWIALVALGVCNRGIGKGNQIFYLFTLQERNGEAKMVCDMARNENGGLLRMEGSGGIGSGGQRCKI